MPITKGAGYIKREILESFEPDNVAIWEWEEANKELSRVQTISDKEWQEAAVILLEEDQSEYRVDQERRTFLAEQLETAKKIREELYRLLESGQVEYSVNLLVTNLNAISNAYEVLEEALGEIPELPEPKLKPWRELYYQRLAAATAKLDELTKNGTPPARTEFIHKLASAIELVDPTATG